MSSRPNSMIISWFGAEGKAKGVKMSEQKTMCLVTVPATDSLYINNSEGGKQH